MKYRNMRINRCGPWSILAGVALLMAGAVDGWACDTPVYRYAMYNWPPAPYIVVHFHNGPIAEEDEAVHDLLRSASRDEADVANVFLQMVDVSEAEQMEQLPEVVAEAWKSQPADAAPLHMVFSPWRALVFTGRLTEAEAKNMLNSPARRELTELLADGNAAVLVMLAGEDEEANKLAEQVTAGVVAKASDGQISMTPGAAMFATPDAPLPSDTATEEPCHQPNTPTLAMVKVSPDDPNEQWLVRCLMSVEPDLGEYKGQPMVFPVYGRGRAMPPYLGQGITEENLTECLAFLCGACSCMIKDQNPGADLLVRYDWDRAAEAMAADEGDDSLSMTGYQEFVAEPADQSTEVTPEQEPTEPEATEPEPTELAAVEEDPFKETDVVVQPADPPVQALKDKSEAEEPSRSSFAGRQAWKLGVALAVAMVVVVIAGLVLMRRQRPD